MVGVSVGVGVGVFVAGVGVTLFVGVIVGVSVGVLVGVGEYAKPISGIFLVTFGVPIGNCGLVFVLAASNTVEVSNWTDGILEFDIIYLWG